MPPSWLHLVLLAVFPAPAALDWITQSCGLRESRNAIRIGTGYLLGIAWGLFFSSLASGLLHFFLTALIVLSAYIISIYAIARRSNLLEEYFS
jgi:uncharacterized membrane protein